MAQTAGGRNAIVFPECNENKRVHADHIGREQDPNSPQKSQGV